MLPFRFASTGNDQARPFSGEGQRRGPTDARQGTGNQDDFRLHEATLPSDPIRGYWPKGPTFAARKDGTKTVLWEGVSGVASNGEWDYDTQHPMQMDRDTNARQSISADLEKALKEIRRSEIELRAIVDAIPAHAWCSRADGYNIYCNQQWLDYSGFTQDEARGWSYRDTIHPDDLEPYVRKWNEVSAAGGSIDAEARLRHVGGEYRWFLIRAVPVRDEQGNISKWFGTNTDIDDRKKAVALLAGENIILEMVATGKPLTTILEELCSLVDRVLAASMSLVLLLDSYNCLRKGAACRFPGEVLSVVDGLKIGPSAVSCGTAAYRKKQVIVADIKTDPLWVDYRELAIKHGLRAAWSSPIFSSDCSVLGVFSLYWDKPKTPSQAHLTLIEQITHLAAVAVERQRSQEALQASERFAQAHVEALTRTLNELAKESDFDRIAGHVLRALISQLGAFSSGVWIRNPTSGLMDFEFALEKGRLRSKFDPALAAVSPPSPVDGVYPWPEIFRTGKPFVFKDIREGPDFPWRTHLLDQGIVTVLIVPMFVAGEPAGVIGIRFEEKREFRADELELAQAFANQAMLAMQLTRLSEKSRRSAVVAERNRMAREVHDTLAQGFTGVIVQLEAAGEAMAKAQPANISGYLERANALARESLQEARRSVRALRPQALQETDLGVALKDLFSKMTSETQVMMKLTVDGELTPLPPEWETNLLRIAQEVLTNALRHSRATEISGRLSYDSQCTSLHLRDDGIGFDPEGEYEGFGLRGIRERAEAMGGQLAIQSEKGRGTSISIVLPITDSKIESNEPLT